MTDNFLQNAKSMVTAARRGREGARSVSEFSNNTDLDDAALEKTSRIRRFSIEDRLLVEIIQQVKKAVPTTQQLGKGFVPANQLCIEDAQTVAIDLYEGFDLEPVRVAASVEGGILLAYKKESDLRLEIEIDNEGDIVGAISTSKKLIRTEIIDLPAKLSKLVRDFKLSRSPAL